MTRAAAIRHLALDINPWVWAYIVAQTFILVALDTLWLLGGNNTPPSLQFCILIYMSANFATQKAPLWRILPVSRIEIDRARWWQGMAVPALLLWIIGCGMALLLEALGRLKVAWPYIAAGVLAQSAVGSLFVGATMVGFAFAARKVGRWSAIMLALLALAIYAITPLQYMWPGLREIMPVLDVLGLATAVGLYVLAGRWPAPLTTTLWNLPAATSSNQIAASAWRGWPVLVLGSFPIFVPIWAMVTGVPILMAYVLPHMDIRFMALILSVAPSQWAVVALATAMRTLRALPLAGWQLACRLALLLLLVQAVSLACLETATIVIGEVGSPGLLVAALAYPLLYFPFILRFPRLIPFGGALTILLIVPFGFLVFYPQITLWLVPASLTVMAIGLLWTWHEIVHGRSAYQVRPLVPSRWRGLG